MDFSASAGKHGIARADVLHALRNAMVTVEVEFDGEERRLTIGPDMSGALLEVVSVPVDEPVLVIHADRLRPKFFHRLPRGGSNGDDTH